MSRDGELYLVLHNIRSAYNVGSIFRTADATGVNKIYLCGYTPNPHKDPKISKTALGAEVTVPWEYHKQTGRLLNQLRQAKIKLIGIEQAVGSKNIFQYKFRWPLALLFGHERQGLNRKLITYVDDILEIPMHGAKESLNVSVAAGIALYRAIQKK